VANKQKVYKANFSLRDKAAVLVSCTAQEIANFVERELKEFDISREQLSVIHYLDTAGVDKMTVNELRETLLDDSPNVSRILNKMVEKGLVRKERQTNDQRVVYVSLTEKGRKLHKQADEKITGHNVRLSSKECQTLIELLMRM
jgi:MarR family transcriptional regulator, organic hydroperoxide resistance regulator